MADNDAKTYLNAQIGMIVKFMNAWTLAGGYEYLQKENKHLFVVKQMNAGEETRGVTVIDFIDRFLVAIQEVANPEIKKISDKEDLKKEDKEKIKAAVPPDDSKKIENFTTNMDEDLRKFLSLFEVYLKEVFFKIEITETKDKKNKTEIEYAFWVGIRMTEDIRIAVKEKKPVYKVTKDSYDELLNKLQMIQGVGKPENLENMKDKAPAVWDKFFEALSKEVVFTSDSNSSDKNLKEFKTKAEYKVPAIFGIIQLEDLYIKIWKTNNDLVKNEMQLEDLKKKYLEHKPEEIES